MRLWLFRSSEARLVLRVCMSFFLNRHLCWSLKELQQISVCLSGWDFGVMVPEVEVAPRWIQHYELVSFVRRTRDELTKSRLSSKVSFMLQNSASATCVINLLQSQLVHIKVSPLGCVSDCSAQIPFASTSHGDGERNHHRGIRHKWNRLVPRKKLIVVPPGSRAREIQVS